MWFIETQKINLCKLYYEPYNFKRTGCCLCPFNIEIEKEYNTLYKLLPYEVKRANYIWKPIFDEYRKIGYRLQEYTQLTIEDY